MENYLVVLLLSVFALICGFYENTVDQRIVQIKDELLHHGKEIKKVIEELESTNKALSEVKVELESTKRELTQVKVELESTRKELKQAQVELESTKREVKQVKVELESTRNELKQAKEELESTKKEVKQVKVELESTRKEFKQAQVELESTKREFKQVKVELESTRKELEKVKVELDKIKKELHTQRPGFYATLSSQTTLGQSQRIEFDKIITDVTNNYNKITGVFTVPKNGLYHFSFTMFSQSGNLHAEIMQNHQVIGRNHGASAYVSAAINVVISCKQGDSIFVRHMAGQGTQNIYGGGFTAFSGFLIN